MFQRTIATALLVLCFALCPHASQADQTLPNFSSVRICAPVNAFIAPGSVPSFSVDADRSVKDAITATVDRFGSLAIGFDKDFKSTNLININISLPATSLQSVEARSTGQTVVGPGFKSPGSFTIAQTGTGDILVQDLSSKMLEISEEGTGDIFVQGLTSEQVVVNAQGTGDVTVQDMNTDIDSLDATTTGTGQLYVRGGIMHGSITASGTGSTYLGGGDIGEVTLDLGGTGSVVIDPTNESTSTTGTLTGTGQVEYTAGSCSVSAGWGSFDPEDGCVKVASSSITSPEAPQIPTATCGIRVQGVINCSGSGGGSVRGLSCAK